MKKNNLCMGIIFILIGVACLMFGLFYDTKLGSLLFGFAGAGIGPGIMMIFKYFYWSSPRNKDRYAELLDKENIELHDERKETLRDRAGRYAYLLGLGVIALSVMTFSIVGQLGYIIDYKIVVIYLFAYLIFQYVIGIIIFRHLDKKY